MRALITLLAVIAAVAAVPSSPQRIIGGSATTINNYPSIAALLYSSTGNNFRQSCGGTLIRGSTQKIERGGDKFWSRELITRWRVRVGSSLAHSQGMTYGFSTVIFHPNFNFQTMDSDIAIMRSSSNIQFSNVIQPGSIAGANYNIADNQVVWAAGWGRTHPDIAIGAEQLRHVQIWTINQAICRQRYAAASRTITDNMLCSGVLDVGGRDQCAGDSGGPLYHNNVVVGVSSFGISCGDRFYPGVNARVSRFTSWIQNNA